MTIMLDMPPEMETQIREEAARRGQSLEAFAQMALREGLTKILPVPASDQIRVAGLNAGPMWISEDFDAPLPDAFWTQYPVSV